MQMLSLPVTPTGCSQALDQPSPLESWSGSGVKEQILRDKKPYNPPLHQAAAMSLRRLLNQMVKTKQLADDYVG